MINLSTIVLWINEVWLADGDLASVPLYAGEAPEDVCLPYVVFTSAGDTVQSDSCTDYDAYVIQFSVYDTNEKYSNVLTIMGDIRDAFDNIQEVGSVQMSRYLNSFTLRDTESKGWSGIMEYTIFTE